MATCKWCRKGGIFIRVDRYGLCNNCSDAILIDVNSRVKVIQESKDIINSSKKLDTVLSRLDTIVMHAQELRKYEDAGISLLTPPPSDLISYTEKKKDDMIISFTHKDVDGWMVKADSAASPKTQITQASKALAIIMEAKKKLLDPYKLNELELRTKKYIHDTQFGIYIDAAQKAEFKGQKKKAIDQYQEALYFLKTDDIDDADQIDQIRELEEKINALSALHN